MSVDVLICNKRLVSKKYGEFLDCLIDYEHLKLGSWLMCGY
jgi:hypothetical protein